MWQRATTLLLVQLALAANASAAAVEVPGPGLLKADGSITGLTRAGSRVILTGPFDHIGPYVGGGVALDPASGARDPGFARIDGQVSDAIVDGHGGWYLGGQFLIGGARRAVTHVLADGKIDPAFDARIGTFVTALALRGDTLYAGRYFWNGARERGVVTLDATTGERRDFASPRGGLGVTELLLADGRLYVGQGGVYAVDPETGVRIDGFDCLACPPGVTALAHAGDSLYMGGTNGVLAVDDATGDRRPEFAPDYTTLHGAPADDPDVGARVMLVDGDRLLVGGESLPFDSPSRMLAAVDLRTGAADPSFAKGFRNAVFDMVLEGDTLLTAGRVRDTRDTAPILKVDRATGAYQDALVPELDGPVDALAIQGDRLFVGGRFATAHRIGTDGVAAVDVRTGRLIPGFSVRKPEDGDPAPLVAGDSLIFPRTDYPQFDVPVGRATAFSLRTGARRDDFRPRAVHLDPAANFSVPVWAAAGDRVYVVYPVDDDPRTGTLGRVRVLSARTGRQLARYDLPYRGYVEDVLPHHGQLFVAGSFLRRHPDGRPRNLATMALDPLTGRIDDGFDAHTNGPVTSIEGFRDRLYLSGYYTVAYGLERDGRSSAYDNTGAIVAGFSRNLDVFGTSDGFLQGYVLSRVVNADPYSGRVQAIVPSIGRVGYTGRALPTWRGAFVTASLNLPYYSYGSNYDNYALLLPYAP